MIIQLDVSARDDGDGANDHSHPHDHHHHHHHGDGDEGDDEGASTGGLPMMLALGLLIIGLALGIFPNCG